MKKLLNNPIVVILLVVVSLFYMYWNVLRPMLGWDQEVKKSQIESSEKQSSNNSSDNNSEEASEDKEMEPQKVTFDSNAVNHFKPSWTFSYSRDPFKKQRRRAYARTVHIEPKSIKRQKPYKKYKRKRSTQFGRGYESIQALSIGPQGTVALIQGQTINLSQSPTLNSDTVSIDYQNKRQNFIFQPKISP